MEQEINYEDYIKEPEKYEKDLKDKLEQSYGKTWHEKTKKDIGFRIERIKVKSHTRNNRLVKGYERGFNFWSDKELELVKINAAKGYREIQRLTPNRSVSSIKTKALRLGLHKKK